MAASSGSTQAATGGQRRLRWAGGRSTGPRPDALEALRIHGRLATAEVAAVCDLPGPRAAAELWRLATEWRVRPTRFLTGELWELA